ncbi:ATP-binding protein [Wenzhouxiangella sp. EGI_FJ10409]|uniref:ATP-binding protein n=1 Tax=Wenzhouxiangella sp. EGI_FJ10409 TaxID=3243767 RepID=UPI0035DB666B
MAERTARSPSLLLRLLVGAGLALLIALAAVGAAMDRVFTNAAEANMRERLEAVVYLILSTIEVDADGQPRLSDSLAEPRLNRPGSSLHGGAMTPEGEWRSPSLMGVEPQPNARLIERNAELFRGLEADGSWNVFAIGLGWEMPGGDIIDLTIWAAEDPNRLRMELAGFRGDLWRWLGLAAVLVIIGQVVLLLLILRPLRRVAHEVSEIESGRRAGIEGRYPRELRPLTDNLNTLLAAERDNARRYSEALADLAHALKTPVAVLRARLESSEPARPSDLARHLDDMEQIIRRQLERAQRSTRRALPAAVPVRPILERMAESLERLHVDSKLRAEVSGGADRVAHMDERDLWEVCGNLMENAAKYGNGRLRASVRAGEPGRRRDGVIIEIEDNGPGIAAAEAERLFQRGQRGDERRDGQGLGLSIVRELVEANGGRLELERSELGGANFRVILPPR